MQHDQLLDAGHPSLAEPKPDVAKRVAAGLHADLGLAPNGKALRHDRLDPWEAGDSERGALPM